MSNKPKTKKERILVLETLISERSLIINVIESALADEEFPPDYQMALRDEISNHNIALEEYKKGLNELNK